MCVYVCGSVSMCVSVCFRLCACACAGRRAGQGNTNPLCAGHSKGLLPLLFFRPLSDFLSPFPASLLPQSQRKKAIDSLPSYPNPDNLDGTFGLQTLTNLSSS